jgi:transketolase
MSADRARGHGAAGGPAAPAVLPAPYQTVLKPYGRALVELARQRPEIVCLSGDLTRQCEIELFQQEFPGRFIHAGMAEANMIGVAGALARSGLIPFVHTFGVFATRRPLDQIVNAVAYPRLPVRIVGFMPGISSPGGPSHQAIEDVALMRALPGMTVVDVADATETGQAVAAIADQPGPVYLRLKRGEIPVIFPPDHRLSLAAAQVLTGGSAAGGVPDETDVALVASGMMVAPALAAASLLDGSGIRVCVLNVPVIKPLDTQTVLAAAAAARVVVTAENHSVIGGLGSAVGRPLRRLGLADTFAEGALSAPYLLTKYGLTTQHLASAAWAALGQPGPAPRAPATAAQAGEYSPV